jgi:ferredoxin--NADP+ reductase
VRTVPELAYRAEIGACCANPQLHYLPRRHPRTLRTFGALLRTAAHRCRRANWGLRTGKDQDRVMLCGNPEMNKQVTDVLEERGW